MIKFDRGLADFELRKMLFNLRGFFLKSG